MDNKLLVLGLNKEGLRLYEKIHETRGKRIYIKISQSELQQWCVRNAKLFTYNVKCYEKKNDNRNDSVTNTESVTIFAQEFCAIINNEIIEGSPKNKLSSSAIKAYGEKVKGASYKMFSIISKANIPTDVRDASLEIAPNYDKMANLFINVPYIPRDFSEGLFVGLLRGAAGDYTGGYGEILNWQEKVRQTIDDHNDKWQKFIIVLIKHGVENLIISDSCLSQHKRDVC